MMAPVAPPPPTGFTLAQAAAANDTSGIANDANGNGSGGGLAQQQQQQQQQPAVYGPAGGGGFGLRARTGSMGSGSGGAGGGNALNQTSDSSESAFNAFGVPKAQADDNNGAGAAASAAVGTPSKGLKSFGSLARAARAGAAFASHAKNKGQAQSPTEPSPDATGGSGYAAPVPGGGGANAFGVVPATSTSAASPSGGGRPNAYEHAFGADPTSPATATEAAVTTNWRGRRMSRPSQGFSQPQQQVTQQPTPFPPPTVAQAGNAAVDTSASPVARMRQQQQLAQQALAQQQQQQHAQQLRQSQQAMTNAYATGNPYAAAAMSAAASAATYNTAAAAGQPLIPGGPPVLPGIPGAPPGQSSTQPLPPNKLQNGPQRLPGLRARERTNTIAKRSGYTRSHTTPVQGWRVPRVKGVLSNGMIDATTRRNPKVRLYRNGDPFYEGKEILLNKRSKTLDHFLEEVTPRMKHGALRRVFSPTTGRRIKNMSELTDGRSYVVAKREPFKRCQYTKIITFRQKEKIHREKKKHMIQKRLVDTQKSNSPTRFKPLSNITYLDGLPVSRPKQYMVAGRIGDMVKMIKPKTIFLLRNGDRTNTAVPMLINSRNARDFRQLFQRISSKLLMEAPCCKLYQITGVPVMELKELEMNGTYVAVARIPFMQVGYKPCPPPSKKGRTLRGMKRGQVKGSYQGKADAKSIMKKKARVAEIISKISGGVNVNARRLSSTMPMDGKNKRRPIQEYKLSVFTGEEENAATNATVFITLFGSLGDSGRRLLTEDDTNFQKGRLDKFVLEVPKVGELKYVRIEHDNTGTDDADSAWYVEHIEVTETRQMAGADQPATVYFWFNDWVQMPPLDQDGDGKVDENRIPQLEAQATLCTDAASAAAELKKTGGLTMDQMQAQSRAYTALEWRILQICNDEKQSKKIWKQLCSNNENKKTSYCQLTAFWAMLTDDFPLLSSMSARMRAFNRSLNLQMRNANEKVEHDTKVGKHTFRLLLINTLLYCRIYSIVDKDDDGHQDVDLSKENLKKKVAFLGLNYDDAAWDREYELMQQVSKEQTGVVEEVVLDVFCAWYSDLKVPSDVLTEAQEAGDKQKRKEGRKRKKREDKKAAADAAKNALAIQNGEIPAPAPEGDAAAVAATPADGEPPKVEELPDDADNKTEGEADGKKEGDAAADGGAAAAQAFLPEAPPVDKEALAKEAADKEAAAKAAKDAAMVDPNQEVVDKIAQIKLSYPANAMAQDFDLEFYKSLGPKARKDLLQCCKPGYDNPEAKVGVFALETRDYDRFDRFFEKLVRRVHAPPPIPKYVDPSKNPLLNGLDAVEAAEREKKEKYSLRSLKAVVGSCRVDARRNLTGFPLTPSMHKVELLALEEKMVQAFEQLAKNPDYGGRYYSLTPGHEMYIDDKGWSTLYAADGYLAKPQDPSLNKEYVSAAIDEDFPSGRGCYMSDDGEVIIWVGSEDHVKITCVSTGFAFGDDNRRLRDTLRILGSTPGLSFVGSNKYGPITVSPSHVGHTMTKSVTISEEAVERLEAEKPGQKQKAIAKCQEYGMAVEKCKRPNAPEDEKDLGCIRVEVRVRHGKPQEDAEHDAVLALKAGLLGFMVDMPAAARKGSTASAGSAAIADKSADAAAAVPLDFGVTDGTKPMDQLEKELQELCSDKDKVRATWDSMKLPSKTGKLSNVNKCLGKIDKRFERDVALQRAFTCVIDPDAGPDDDANVERSDFGTLVVMTLYFTKLFALYPDAEKDTEKRLDLASFKDTLKKLGFEMDPVEAANEFDAMESNDGGSIDFNDFVVWYCARKCPFVFDQEPEQTTMTAADLPIISISSSTNLLDKAGK